MLYSAYSPIDMLPGAPAATVTGTLVTGAEISGGHGAGVQAWLDGTSGAITATVLIEVTNNPLALTDPTNNAVPWSTLQSFSLSSTGAGAGVAVGQTLATLPSVSYLVYRARVSAISGVGTRCFCQLMPTLFAP